MCTKSVLTLAALMLTGAAFASTLPSSSHAVLAKPGDCCGCDCCPAGVCYPGCCPCCCTDDYCVQQLPCCDVGAACCVTAPVAKSKACCSDLPCCEVAPTCCREHAPANTK